MSQDTRIEDMSPAAIAQLLAVPDYLLNEDQATAVCDFVDRIGGIENAWLAVELLSQIGVRLRKGDREAVALRVAQGQRSGATPRSATLGSRTF